MGSMKMSNIFTLGARKLRNCKKRSGNSIAGHPVVVLHQQPGTGEYVRLLHLLHQHGRAAQSVQAAATPYSSTSPDKKTNSLFAEQHSRLVCQK